MLSNLQILNLQPQVCLRDRDSAYKPINLYHKVGHGKLDMYVINPSKEAKEIREFMERWNGENSKTLGKILQKKLVIYNPNFFNRCKLITSLCFILYIGRICPKNNLYSKKTFGKRVKMQNSVPKSNFYSILKLFQPDKNIYSWSKTVLYQ